MSDGARRHLLGGFWTNSLGTLASRVLGLVRDIATASLLGLGEGGAMDALVIAFRIPNLTRRIFGEGALAASFLPVFAAEHARGPRHAWQLTSVLLGVLTIVLTVLALMGELICAVWWWLDGADRTSSLLIGLTATLLPYLVFICLAAQVSAALQALLEFRWPALAPMLLNVCWLAAAWFIAPRFDGDKPAQAYCLAIAILVSGLLQLAVQLPALRRVGFRWDFDWLAAREPARSVLRSMLPIALGMAVTQLNTLLDSFIAWGLSSDATTDRAVWWLGGAVDYPLRSGAAAAIYYGERFYQLPVGMLGIAIATVVYPLLNRHAARGDFARLGEDLTLGLRLVWFTALPAGVGIMLVAEPMTRLLFQHGEFTADDSLRAARMIAAYASGVWAYCALPVLVRGFYAMQNRATPALVGLAAVGVNLALNLALVWPLAEVGLAISTAIAAGMQVVMLTAILSRGASRLAWDDLLPTLIKGALATLVMAMAVAMCARLAPIDDTLAGTEVAARLAAAIALGVAAYVGSARMLRMSELSVLFSRPRTEGSQGEP